MANPFLAAGASLEKPTRYSPLHSNEFFTGLWTNRNPLRDPATPYLFQKFYSATRYDSIIAGLNAEISPRLTLVRRPGHSVYNSQAFTNVQGFYSFHVFNPLTLTGSIRVIVDTATAVYDGTGPNTKALLFTKAAGAGQISFQAVGNTLYMGDGVDLLKWVWAPYWTTNTTYPIGSIILDSNNNIQEMLGEGTQVSSTSVSTNVLTVTFSSFPPWIVIGAQVTFYGLVNQPWLNGLTVTIAGISGLTFTVNIVHANYTTSPETAAAAILSPATAAQSVSIPTFSSTIGAVIPGAIALGYDVFWMCKGPSIQNWGIVAPTVAPTVANSPNTNLGSAWAANTYYGPSISIVDANTNAAGPYIWNLTTSGTTNVSVPATFTGSAAQSVGAQLTDGNAVWTCQGSAVRVASHAYVVGTIIKVTFTVVQVVRVWVPSDNGRGGGGGGNYQNQTITYGPYTNFFSCSTAGTASSATTASIAWPAGVGTQIQDGSVTWTNIGPSITRTVAATSASNIGNSQLVSITQEIVDSNGNYQTITVAGEVGANHPTWATVQGNTTPDNQASWINGGPATAANTGAWGYAYAFKNSISGHVSSASPMSIPILLQASSFIAVSGLGSSDSQVDTIEIYRTVQGTASGSTGGTLFWLQDIPAPPNGAPWSYGDFSPDPPSPNTTLNEFIEADTNGNNAPPPAGLVALTYHLNRIFGAAGPFSYYTIAPGASIGVGAESFPGLNYFQFPETVTVQWPSSGTIYYFLVKGVYASGTTSGGGPGQPSSVPLDDVGILSPNCFTVNGSTPLILTSDLQCLSFDPSAGLSRMAFQIEDVLANFSASGSYLAWYTRGSDQALYVCDGSTGWYRGVLTPTPEASANGTTWSPKATIVGGVKAIKAVEVSPGLNRLLLGAGSVGGPILFRDTTTNTDNGTSYPAWFTIGSLVLAQSGQCAEIGYITTETLAVGSQLAMTVLVDEISGTPEPLTNFVPDPPFLPTSQSIYANRWYFSQLNEAAWMHHCQLTFTWPTENHPNELLDYTLWGSVHHEGE